VATDRAVALDPSGGGPRATSIFCVTLSDARDRRRTLTEPPLGAAVGIGFLWGTVEQIGPIWSATRTVDEAIMFG
jgi:hypothetical protein